eukprot:PITA_17934
MKMVDSELSNNLFTWNNKRGGAAQVASKLDTFMISEELMLIDKEISARVLPFGGSDHWPIQLEMKGMVSPRNRPFRFENIWLSHPDFTSNIEKWWSEDLQFQGSKMYLLHKRLKHIKFSLKEWNKKDFDGFDKVKSDQGDKHHQECENLCKQEEIFWRQKSRVQWLKEGERNTRFFHRSTTANRAYKRISTTKDENGELENTHKNIEAVLSQHFRNITRENNPDREQSMREITRHITKLVPREENLNLNGLVTEEEVSEVLKDMQNCKAPGPDGFNVHFFKACWHIVKQGILNVVEDSRGRKTILKALNTSFISLIPKQDSAQIEDKYRPIDLCNVVYKIISKGVADRLKPLLPSLVAEEQSGYVEGRQILNNIIKAHEVVHTLTYKRQMGMIMQLDIAKAYDKVNWIYIKKVLTAFGFDHNWVRWVMALVTTSSFSILVNGSPSDIFIPSRGVRQGDPLSPFLFILMMEGLGRSIKHAKAMGKIKGIQLSKNGQAPTRQQFVDDTMQQGIPIVKEALAYNKILKEFSTATGMEVNLSKSKISFLNTSIAIQRNISRILGFQRDSLPTKYLGVPLRATPMHKSIWEPVLNKLQDRVKEWILKVLNLAGRLVLTKSVLQSIPIFMLSALLAPKGVLEQFRNIQRDFL